MSQAGGSNNGIYSLERLRTHLLPSPQLWMPEQGMEACNCRSSVSIGSLKKLTGKEGNSHGINRVDGLTNWEIRQMG